MKPCTSRLIEGIVASSCLFAASATAQIIPDNSLGTVTTGNCDGFGGTCLIRGGTQRDHNLFHSFSQFSLPNQDAAGFIVSPQTRHAIIRVTGQGSTFTSRINGEIATISETLQISQPVDFFLINPNGIIFGPNANLNFSGSFLATTAQQIRFQDDSNLSAQISSPALTLSVPIGLQFGQKVADIKVDQSLLFSASNKGIALLGGNLEFLSAFLNSNGGHIELGSMAAAGSVMISAGPSGWGADYTEIDQFGDISLFDTFIRASSDNLFSPINNDLGGDIQIHSKDLNLINSSRIFTQAGVSNSGNITIRARGVLDAQKDALISAENLGTGNAGKLELSVGTLNLGENAKITAQSDTGAGGNAQIRATGDIKLFSNSAIQIASVNGNVGGNLFVETNNLNLIGDALIDTGAFAGQGGSITIKAKDSVVLEDAATLSTFSLQGLSGNVNLEVKKLELQSGSEIFTDAFSQKAGDVNITALDSISLVGNMSQNSVLAPSSISTKTQGFGAGGNVQLNTEKLIVTDGSSISASSNSLGKGGNININAREIELGMPMSTLPLGTIETIANSAGAAGNININSGLLRLRGGSSIAASTLGLAPGGVVDIASDRIEILGSSSGEDSKITVQTLGLENQSAGSIKLRTGELLLKQGGQVNAIAQGIGDAGNIFIQADALAMDEQGQILTQSELGQGGNIILGLDDSLLIRNGSSISTTAGRFRDGGDGGDITITTPFLISLPNENSDIIANAFSGSGGNITINANAIFNFQLQDEPNIEVLRNNRTNDISASSQFGSSGTLSLSGLNTDPSQGSNELPADLINPADQISRRCSVDRTAQSQNQFFITGNGGLPPRPGDPTPSSFTTGTIISTNPTALAPTAQTAVAQPLNPNSSPEADGWKRDRQGNIQLIAHHHSTRPQPSGLPCPARPL